MLAYRAYGLRIASELPLPELVQAEDRHDPPDIRIRFGRARKDPDRGRALGEYIWGQPGELWFHIPDVGQFLISRGEEIWIDPAPAVAEDAIRLYLLGSAFGALLLQRGFQVLHGNAIRVGESCLVCVGESGAGKSTLAAGFMRRGFDVLADDVVPVDAHNRAIPGFPRLKLWKDAAEHLKIETQGLQPIRSAIDKFNVPLSPVHSESAIPVRWIYVLGREDAPGFRLEELRGIQKFEPLANNAYRPEFLMAMDLQAANLRACSGLARAARVCRITRPDNGFALEELIDTLLRDIEGKP